MKNSITLREALKISILERHKKPVIALHEFNSYIYSLYRDKEFDGKRISKIKAAEPESRILDDCLEEMIELGFLLPAISGYVWQISNKTITSAQQIACCMNPFSHLAYLSAMEWHGITDRIPYVIHLSQAPLNQARIQTQNELIKIFPDIVNLQPLLPRGFKPYEKIDGKEFIFHTTKNYKKKQELHDSGGVRVSNIGETFLDMLKEPDLCGGYKHVHEVYQEYAKDYLPIIVKTIDKDGNSIDKARAGYILEELCNLNHKIINNWKLTVQRGGSRRLVASNPYVNTFSEVWCISINN